MLNCVLILPADLHSLLTVLGALLSCPILYQVGGRWGLRIGVIFHLYGWWLLSNEEDAKDLHIARGMQGKKYCET